MKKILSIALALTVGITMCMGTTAFCHAAGVDGLQVTVVDNTVSPVVEVTLTEDQLVPMIKTGYKYSKINHYGTVSTQSSVRGIKVSSILAKAGVNFGEGETITFVSADSTRAVFRYEEYAAAKYYFPAASDRTIMKTLAKGPINKSKATAEKKTMPTILAIENADMDATLFFGQANPGYRNEPQFIKYVGNGGKIIIDKAGTKEKAKAFTSPTIPVGSTVELGTRLDFNDEWTKDAFAHFTIDGSEPTAYSAVYNYNTFEDSKFDSQHPEWVNPVILKKAGNITVKVVVMERNKYNSEVASFNYIVPPVDPIIKLTPGNKLFKIKVTNTTGVSKYTLKYKAKGKSWKTLSMTGSSKTVKKLPKGICQVKIQGIADDMRTEIVKGTVKVK